MSHNILYLRFNQKVLLNSINFSLHSFSQEIRVIASLSICALECMFLGGVLIAWVPLLYTFIDDGIYKDKCVYNNVTQVKCYTLKVIEG